MGPLPQLLVLVAVLIAAGTDLWSFRIYNVLTIPLCLFGLLYHWSVGGPSGLVSSILGVLVANVPFFPLWMKSRFGAGDMALLAGVGAWLGPWAMLHVIIVSGLATGCYTIVLMIRQHMQSVPGQVSTVALGGVPPDLDSGDNVRDLLTVLKQPNRRACLIPYGAMVAIGVIVTKLWIG
jgi:prepilin peptidase CpaA